MKEHNVIGRSKSDTALSEDGLAMEGPAEALESLLPSGSPRIPSESSLSRTPSHSASSSYHDDWDPFPLDRLTLVDILGNLTLPQKLEKWQQTLNQQKEKVKKHQQKLKSTSLHAREKVVGEWRKRMPSSDEQLDKYRRLMKDSVDRLGSRWTDIATVTVREKLSFIAGVFNIFISGYLIGACPQFFYYWFTAQLLYFIPLRFYTYHKKGWHYFMADLCYFVNFMMLLSIWVFPQSKRLFLSTYCLAYGNNAVAIAMWRNSLVFHSLDKVTSLFIHITPPVTLHCLVHMTHPEILKDAFPAIYAIKFSQPGSPEHYSLGGMILWASVPYAIWQLSYHLLITVRRREEIAAGRPTSFTWLRKSYAKTWLGKLVLHLPESLQAFAFMLIQYAYAILTILPCPLWFWYKWASTCFLVVLFFWSILNGATYYIDVFGKRFEKELEQLRKDVAKFQSTPETFATIAPEGGLDGKNDEDDSLSNQNIEATFLDGKQGATGVETSPAGAVNPKR